jgi:hypothetical protein
MRHTLIILAITLTCAGLVGALARPAGALSGAATDTEYTEDFPVDHCRFRANGRNMYMSLEPGYQLYLEGDDDGEFVTLLITVLHDTERISFDHEGERIRVKTRVVEEREYADGELVEVSRNFLALCQQTGDIYYVGEDVDDYEDGEIVGHEGAWRAGVDGALPGILMPGSFLLGSRYFQELAPGVALDRAEHVEMGVTTVVPAGEFEDSVVVFEDSALEPDADSEKIYGPGVGLLVDDALELVWFGFGDDDDDSDDSDDSDD